MENKKRNQLARNGQGSSDFKSKNQDVSNKQSYPRHRRRESYQSENINGTKQQSNKNRNNNFYYDKRPARKNGNGGGSDLSAPPSGEATGLMEADELNSVFNHGRRNRTWTICWTSITTTQKSRMWWGPVSSPSTATIIIALTPRNTTSTRNNICKPTASS